MIVTPNTLNVEAKWLMENKVIVLVVTTKIRLQHNEKYVDGNEYACERKKLSKNCVLHHSITASTCKRMPEKGGKTYNVHFVDRINSLGQW